MPYDKWTSHTHMHSEYCQKLEKKKYKLLLPTTITHPAKITRQGIIVGWVRKMRGAGDWVKPGRHMLTV